ncbi:hypothetical protein ACFL6S_11120 [Candidatus Poribacteria bacterium]
MKVPFLIIMLFLAIGVSSLQAQQELAVGVRPMGFAGAFSAVADDANALMWNPAGIAQLTQQELTSMWTDLYGFDITQSYLGYVQPIANKLTVGTDWTATQFDDDELSFGKHRVHIAGAYRPLDWIYCGLNMKYIFSSATLDGVSAGDSRRLDGDIGLLLHSPLTIPGLDRAKLAFVLRDVASTDITHEYQSKISHESVSARRWVLGFAYDAPLIDLTISAESDIQMEDRMRIGGEYKFPDLPVGIEAMVRAGLHRYWDTGQGTSWTLGGSLGIPFSNYAKTFFEYVYMDSSQLSGTHRFALRIPFDFNPTAVSIVDPHCDDLFASLYRRYAKESVISLDLLNKQEQAIEPQMTVAAEGYEASSPLVPALAGKTQQHLSFPINLSDDILDIQQDRLSITLEVRPPEGLRFEPARAELSPFVHPRGKVPWTQEEGVRPYVAFITPEDLCVVDFARDVVEQYQGPGDLEQILPQDEILDLRSHLEKFLQAIMLYEALRSHGVYYRLDRNQGQRLIESTESDVKHIEDVKYPRDYLSSSDLGGDCDDWAVLYSSLLESLGIMTALVEVPGHVFIAFNTGVPCDKKARLGLKPGRFIELTDPEERLDTIWIPVDTPLRLDDSFYDCWEDGLDKWNASKESGSFLRLVIVREAQGDYPPALLDGSGGELVKPLDYSVLDGNLRETLSHFITEWEKYWKD